ncbi:MAG: dephospho-CoA kinase [Candidatus Kapaibacterium sp.]
MNDSSASAALQPASDHTPIVVIGITGTIGSGKSTVAGWIREAGHTVFSSDATAASLMDSDPLLQEQLIATFGAGIFDEHRTVNRSALAALVFGATPEHHARLAMLNRIVHPRVLEEHERQIREAEAAGLSRVFIESALIYEAELEDAFDYIIVIDSTADACIARVRERSGLGDEDVRARMSEQMTSAEKAKHADFVIRNDSTLAALRDALMNLLPILAILPPRMEEDTEGDDAQDSDDLQE